MGNFVKENFPVLLLATLVMIFSGITLLVFFKLSANKDAINWATTAFTGLLGALLGLITGRISANHAKSASQEDSGTSTAN